MRDFRLKRDLERVVIDGYALPLGLIPAASDRPREGYTLEYVTGEEEDPDTYSFYVNVSATRLPGVTRACFGLLSGEVHPIVEIGSRDAYREVDVWMSQDPVTRTRFIEGWDQYASFLFESGSISAGANCSDPEVEIFLDPWKGLAIHVPLRMREDVEMILEGFGLSEELESWVFENSSANAGQPTPDPFAKDDGSSMRVREVLDLAEPDMPGVEEILLDLQDLWELQLNIDPDVNVNDAGRRLGHTLWQAVLLLRARTSGEDLFGTIWSTAANLLEAETLVAQELERHTEFELIRVYSIDRVAFDERPDQLNDLAPRQTESGVHLFAIDATDAFDDGSTGTGAGLGR